VFEKFDKLLQLQNKGTNQTDRPYRYDKEYGKKPRTVSPPSEKLKAKTDRGITEWSQSYTKFKTMFGELEDYINKSPKNSAVAAGRDYEYPLKVKNPSGSTAAPSNTSLSKIYLQKPDLSLFNRKKSKSNSLNTSLTRNRKISPGMRAVKTPKNRVSALPLPYPKPQLKRKPASTDAHEEYK
jgi:hypothetical protein